MKLFWMAFLLLGLVFGCPDQDQFCAQCAGKKCVLCYASYILEGMCAVPKKLPNCEVD